MQGGVFETGAEATRVSLPIRVDYPLRCRGNPGSLRWRLRISVRTGSATRRSQFIRDTEERISDTRVLCVVVVTHLGITVFVAAETRARPVHRRAKVMGVRRPARINAR